MPRHSGGRASGEIADFLADIGLDSISVTTDALLTVVKRLGIRPGEAEPVAIGDDRIVGRIQSEFACPFQA